jgi:hypothetical protein
MRRATGGSLGAALPHGCYCTHLWLHPPLAPAPTKFPTCAGSSGPRPALEQGRGVLPVVAHLSPIARSAAVLALVAVAVMAALSSAEAGGKNATAKGTTLSGAAHGHAVVLHVAPPHTSSSPGQPCTRRCQDCSDLVGTTACVACPDWPHAPPRGHLRARPGRWARRHASTLTPLLKPGPKTCPSTPWNAWYASLFLYVCRPPCSFACPLHSAHVQRSLPGRGLAGSAPSTRSPTRRVGRWAAEPCPTSPLTVTLPVRSPPQSPPTQPNPYPNPAAPRDGRTVLTKDGEQEHAAAGRISFPGPHPRHLRSSPANGGTGSWGSWEPGASHACVRFLRARPSSAPSACSETGHPFLTRPLQATFNASKYTAQLGEFVKVIGEPCPNPTLHHHHHHHHHHRPRGPRCPCVAKWREPGVGRGGVIS